MKNYVVGFAFNDNHVLLIEKKRPSWQKGSYNGIGGHIEEGETPKAAMVREFEEECGIASMEKDWEQFAIMKELEVAAVRELAAMQTIRITNVPVLFTCSTELRQPLLWQCRCWEQFCQIMENEKKETGNLISDLTNGEVTKIPFGGDAPEIGFSLSEWQKAYLVNGSYRTPTDDGSVFGSKINQARIRNGFDPI